MAAREDEDDAGAAAQLLAGLVGRDTGEADGDGMDADDEAADADGGAGAAAVLDAPALAAAASRAGLDADGLLLVLLSKLAAEAFPRLCQAGNTLHLDDPDVRAEVANLQQRLGNFVALVRPDDPDPAAELARLANAALGGLKTSIAQAAPQGGTAATGEPDNDRTRRVEPTETKEPPRSTVADGLRSALPRVASQSMRATGLISRLLEDATAECDSCRWHYLRVLEETEAGFIPAAASAGALETLKACLVRQAVVVCFCGDHNGQRLCAQCDERLHMRSVCSGRFVRVVGVGGAVLHRLAPNEFINTAAAEADGAMDSEGSVAGAAAAAVSGNALSPDAIVWKAVPLPVQGVGSCKGCGSSHVEPVPVETPGSTVTMFRQSFTWEAARVTQLRCTTLGCGQVRPAGPLVAALAPSYLSLNPQRLHVAVAVDVADALLAEAKHSARPRSAKDIASTLGRGLDVKPPSCEPHVVERTLRRWLRAHCLYHASIVRALQWGTESMCHICGPMPRRVSCDANLNASQRKSASSADAKLALPNAVLIGEAACSAVEATKLVTGGALDKQCADGAAVTTWTAAGGVNSGHLQQQRIKGTMVLACPHELPLRAYAMRLPESVHDHTVMLLLAAHSGAQYLASDIACLLHRHVSKQGAKAATWLDPALRELFGEAVTVSARVRATGASEPLGIEICVEPSVPGPDGAEGTDGAAAGGDGGVPGAAAAASMPTGLFSQPSSSRTVVYPAVPALHAYAHTCSPLFGNLSVAGIGLGDEYVERLFARLFHHAASVGHNASLVGFRVHWETVMSLYVMRQNEDIPCRLLHRLVRILRTVHDRAARVPALRVAYDTAAGATAMSDADLLKTAAAARLELFADAAGATRAAAPSIEPLVQALNLKVAISTLQRIVGADDADDAGGDAGGHASAIAVAVLQASPHAQAALKAVRAGKVDSVAAARAALTKLQARLAALERGSPGFATADINSIVATALRELHDLTVRVKACTIELELARGDASKQEMIREQLRKTRASMEHAHRIASQLLERSRYVGHVLPALEDIKEPDDVRLPAGMEDPSALERRRLLHALQARDRAREELAFVVDDIASAEQSASLLAVRLEALLRELQGPGLPAAITALVLSESEPGTVSVNMGLSRPAVHNTDVCAGIAYEVNRGLLAARERHRQLTRLAAAQAAALPAAAGPVPELVLDKLGRPFALRYGIDLLRGKLSVRDWTQRSVRGAAAVPGDADDDDDSCDSEDEADGAVAESEAEASDDDFAAETEN